MNDEQNATDVYACGLEDGEVEHTSTIAARIDALEEEVGALKIVIADILARMPAILIEGRIPSLSVVSRIECQIFHTPNLTPNQRKAKTEWSLRLTVYIQGKRAKPDQNVRLYAGDRFYRMAMGIHPLPDHLERAANRNKDNSGILLGLLQAVTDGGGTPYIPDQFCGLSNYVDNSVPPTVDMRVGDDVIRFEAFVRGKGKKAGHAKWYCNWYS
jgi:hypothetical protein